RYGLGAVAAARAAVRTRRFDPGAGRRAPARRARADRTVAVLCLRGRLCRTSGRGGACAPVIGGFASGSEGYLGAVTRGKGAGMRARPPARLRARVIAAIVLSCAAALVAGALEPGASVRPGSALAQTQASPDLAIDIALTGTASASTSQTDSPA